MAANIKLKKKDIADLASFKKSKENDKAYFEFVYLYTDDPYCQFHSFGMPERRYQWHKNSKIFGSISKSTVEIINDEQIITIMNHVDEKINMLFANELIMLKDEIFKGCLNELNDLGFSLYYFESYSDCFIGLKKFLDNLQYLTLIDDTIDPVTLEFSNDVYRKASTLESSFLTNYFSTKFVESFGASKLDPFEKQYFKIFYDATYESVIHELLIKKMKLLIGGSYTIGYNLKKVYDLIIEIVNKTQQNFISLIHGGAGYSNVREVITHFLNESSEKETMLDIFDRENILKYFTDFFNKKIATSNDFEELEKVVCDFFNMIKYLSDMFKIQCFKQNTGYTKPIYYDNYKCRIIEGIDIVFFDSPEEGKIRAYNSKGEKVSIEKGVDYFHTLQSSIFISFENIANKGIQEIEVISGKYEVLYRFRIN